MQDCFSILSSLMCCIAFPMESPASHNTVQFIVCCLFSPRDIENAMLSFVMLPAFSLGGWMSTATVYHYIVIQYDMIQYIYMHSNTDDMASLV